MWRSAAGLEKRLEGVSYRASTDFASSCHKPIVARLSVTPTAAHPFGADRTLPRTFSRCEGEDTELACSSLSSGTLRLRFIQLRGSYLATGDRGFVCTRHTHDDMRRGPPRPEAAKGNDKKGEWLGHIEAAKSDPYLAFIPYPSTIAKVKLPPSVLDDNTSTGPKWSLASCQSASAVREEGKDGEDEMRSEFEVRTSVRTLTLHPVWPDVITIDLELPDDAKIESAVRAGGGVRGGYLGRINVVAMDADKVKTDDPLGSFSLSVCEIMLGAYKNRSGSDMFSPSEPVTADSNHEEVKIGAYYFERKLSNAGKEEGNISGQVEVFIIADDSSQESGEEFIGDQLKKKSRVSDVIRALDSFREFTRQTTTNLGNSQHGRAQLKKNTR